MLSPARVLKINFEVLPNTRLLYKENPEEME
jgi:hypothetical protein